MEKKQTVAVIEPNTPLRVLLPNLLDRFYQYDRGRDPAIEQGLPRHAKERLLGLRQLITKAICLDDEAAFELHFTEYQQILSPQAAAHDAAASPT